MRLLSRYTNVCSTTPLWIVLVEAKACPQHGVCWSAVRSGQKAEKWEFSVGKFVVPIRRCRLETLLAARLTRPCQAAKGFTASLPAGAPWCLVSLHHSYLGASHTPCFHLLMAVRSGCLGLAPDSAGYQGESGCHWALVPHSEGFLVCFRQPCLPTAPS